MEKLVGREGRDAVVGKSSQELNSEIYFIFPKCQFVTTADTGKTNKKLIY